VIAKQLLVGDIFYFYGTTSNLYSDVNTNRFAFVHSLDLSDVMNGKFGGLVA